MTSTSRRSAMVMTCTALASAAALALTGCSRTVEEPSIHPSQAKQSIVEQVDTFSAAIGGGWGRYSGPAVLRCGQADGTEGAAWEYIVERTDTTGTHPKTDVTTMSSLWKELGIVVQEYQSGGVDPVLGVRGRGGPLLSISFDAYPGRYSITGVSQCSDGDPTLLQREHRSPDPGPHPSAAAR